MKENIKKKPWYFLFLLLVFIIKPIGGWIVMHFFDSEKAELILNMYYNIRLDNILLGLFFIVALPVCTVVFFFRREEALKTHLNKNELNLINDSFQEILDEYEYVESIQAYTYKIINADQKTLKVNYLVGLADERIEINSIMQSYFYFIYPLYKRIDRFIQAYNAYNCESKPDRKSSLKAIYYEEGLQLSKTLIEKLNDIDSVADIGSGDCELYRTLLIVLTSIYEEKAITSVLKDSTIEERLICNKKTGLLGAILTKELYIFRNESSMIKKGRIYFTYHLDNLANKNRIVIIVSIKCDDLDENKDIKDYCKSITEKISVVLNKKAEK